jgi:hypothetical protein
MTAETVLSCATDAVEVAAAAGKAAQLEAEGAEAALLQATQALAAHNAALLRDAAAVTAQVGLLWK